MPTDTMLSRGVVLTRDERENFCDIYVTIPVGPDSPRVDALLLDKEVGNEGLILLDQDEIEPILTPQGLKVWCAYKEGGNAEW